MLSTTKLFVLIAIVFILIFVFVIGLNPFSLAEPYFKSQTASPSLQPSLSPSLAPIVIPDNPDPIPEPSVGEPAEEIRIDR